MNTPESPARRFCKTPPPFSYSHLPGTYSLSPSRENWSPGRSSTSPTPEVSRSGHTSISPTPGSTNRLRFVSLTSSPSPIRRLAPSHRSSSVPFLPVSKNLKSVPLGTTSVSPEQPHLGPGATFSTVPKRPSTLPTDQTLQPTKHEIRSHEQQRTTLLRFYKQRKCVLGLFYMPRSNRVTNEIETVMKKLLSGSQSVVKVFKMSSGGSFWLTNATKAGVTNYMFLCDPPAASTDRAAQVSRFFNPNGNHGRRVVEVIFVTNVQATASPIPQNAQEVSPGQKQFQQFLHLDGSLKTTCLVDCILAHFSG